MTHRKDGAFFMTASISQELRLFAEELQRSLSSSTLQQVAREVGFVQRESKYQAQDLAALCIWVNQRAAEISLTRLHSCLEASTTIWLIIYNKFTIIKICNLHNKLDIIIRFFSYTNQKRSSC